MAETFTSAIEQEGAAAIVAAATVWRGSEKMKNMPVSEVDRGWQQEIWGLSDQIPELSFYESWHHNAASRVRLRAVRMVDGDPVDVSGEGIGTEPGIGGTTSPADVPGGSGGNGPLTGEKPKITGVDRMALDLVNGLAGGPAGAAQLLARSVLHLCAVGETYTVIRDESADALAPFTEIRWTDNNGWEVESGQLGVFEPVGDGLVIRAWEQSPSRRVLAWSPMKAALPVLRELAALTQLVGAEADSRLSAGIWLIPQEWVPPGGIKQFTEELIEQLSSPIMDRAAASSIVPLPIPMPHELIESAVKGHIRFGMNLSEQTHPLRDESVRRFAMGARIPPEILTGTGHISHWGQWFVDEQGIKLFIAPEVHIVLHAWTVGWLRPALEAMGVDKEKAAEYSVWPDFTPLVLRPDRSSDAVSLYDRLLLSGKAVLRETGFDPNDAPSDAEKLEQLIVTVARQAPNAIGELIPLMPGLPPEVAERFKLLNQRPGNQQDALVQPSGGGGEPSMGVDGAHDNTGATGPGRGI